jgi:hypothetical protein
MIHAMAAEKAFRVFRRDGSMSLSMFLKEFNARRAIINIHECDVPSEIKLTALFIEKLDSGRYWQLKDFVRSSIVPRKTTVSAAYEQASEWTVRRSQVQAQHKEIAWQRI